jgi:transposase
MTSSKQKAKKIFKKNGIQVIVSKPIRCTNTAYSDYQQRKMYYVILKRHGISISFEYISHLNGKKPNEYEILRFLPKQYISPDIFEFCKKQNLIISEVRQEDFEKIRVLYDLFILFFDENNMIAEIKEML